ncbi:hypothetical protein Zmor_012167 [Zophobas morio]|jgi:hypothetical protein|uniref:Uncharacterized protein n=2 Tax=Zophobas morio TaxID=2755281 RepID=A0AA38HIL7_9CUCU|nr:hypothetical protein Zmor_012167 [Zophobas morio]
MNACSIHLLAFFKAKWMHAELLSTAANSSYYKAAPQDFKFIRMSLHEQLIWERDKFDKILDLWNCSPFVRWSCHKICYQMSEEEVRAIRLFFAQIGKQAVNKAEASGVVDLSVTYSYIPKHRRKQAPYRLI